jgi:flagellar FliJ protein
MMFRFRLQRVLEVRRREVEARSREVAQAQAVLAAARRAEDEAARDLQRGRQRQAEARQGTLDPTALARFGQWQDAQQRRLQGLQAGTAAAREQVGMAQTRLQAAWKDREVLERLRERQHREWQQEQARRERRTLDEVASIRAALRAPAAVPGPEAGE